MQQSPFLTGGTIPWWQKGLALIGLCATIAFAAVIGVIILYVLLIVLVLAFLAGLFLYIRFKFFPPKRRGPTAKRGPDNITIIETPDGVVIDMSAETSSGPDKGSQ